MSIDEFEKLISRDVNKLDILDLVNQGIKLGNYKGQAAEEWYDYCAHLYELSEYSYIDFKWNMSNRLDSIRYSNYINQRRAKEDIKEAVAYQELCKSVQQYVEQGKLYNESQLINKLVGFVMDFERYKKTYFNKVSELEDYKVIVKLSKKLRRIKQIRFRTTYPTDSDYENPSHIQSEKALLFFKELFIPYYQNRFMSEINPTNLNKINEDIKKFKLRSNLLIHKLIYDIYTTFAKLNLTDFKSDVDRYKMKETRNGKYVSLNGDISIWIFDFIDYYGYLKDLGLHETSSVLTRKNKIDLIKDRLKVFSQYESLDWPKIDQDYYML